MKKIYIIGSGGHCRSLINIIFNNKKKIAKIFDINVPKVNEKIFGVKVGKYDIKNISRLKKNNKLYLAIGNQKIRKRIFSILIKNKIKILNLIAKSAEISFDLKIMSGNVICSKVYIGPGVNIGNNNLINTSSIIEHEVTIGNHCNIAPGVIVCGRVNIGNNVSIGPGTTIIDNLKISDNVIIGAGSLVTKSIINDGTYFGKPIKKVS
jgi:sugar O-acyltransferase (sialic acid O-acetyltransferase NeuD family)